MADHKKTTDRGVVDSIAALRHLRYMTKGAGAKPLEDRSFRRGGDTHKGKMLAAGYVPAALPTVDQLREKVSKVAIKVRKKKSKTKGKRR